MPTNFFDNAQDDYFTRKGASNDAPPFFVGRETELKAADTALQQGDNLLYLGPRGVGKTYCIWQIASLLRHGSAPFQNCAAIPIRSDEDFRDFPDLPEFILDLFLRLGKEVANWDKDESLRIVGRGQREQDAGAHRTYMEMVLTGPWRDNQDAFFTQVASDIRKTCHKLERHGVLFLENFDDFMARILKDDQGEQERFTTFLQQANLRLIASSITYPPAWELSDNPFYKMFNVVPMQEFSQAEAREMLMKLAEHQKDIAFQLDINQRDSIIETLYPFTDGNARSLAMCYTAVRASHGKKKNIRRALSTLLSASTPYYQERFKRQGLHTLRLKLLIHLVRSGKPLSLEFLSQKLGEESQPLQDAMHWLQDHHYVKPQDKPQNTPQDDREDEQHYIVKDTLFRMWMEVRQTPDSLQRINHLISFFETIHEGKNPSKGYANNIGDIAAWETSPEDHEILKKRLNKVWLESLPKEVYAAGKSLYDAQDAEGLWIYHAGIIQDRTLTETEQLSNFETMVAVFLFFLRDFPQANALFETIFQTYKIDNEAIWLLYSRSLLLGQERLETIVAFNEQWRNELPNEQLAAYYHLGVTGLMAGKYDEAVQAFERCMTLKAKHWNVRKPVILANKGQALLLSNRVEEALESCLGALNLEGGETIPQIHRNLVGIYLTMGDEEKAKQHLLKTIQCLKEYHDSRNLGMSLRILFLYIADDSPLVDDCVTLVETFISVTQHGFNQVRIQRLLNHLISTNKLNIAGKIVATFKNGPFQLTEMFLPYVYAFEIFGKKTIRDRNEFKKGLLPELRNATEIILQMMHMTQEQVPTQK